MGRDEREKNSIELRKRDSQKIDIMAAEISSIYETSSHSSKSSTRSRFWNRSFHILPCEERMEARRSHPNHNNDANNPNCSERENSSICRLDRNGSGPRCSWSRCNWKSFMASVMIVLLQLAATIECLQPRQEASSNCVFPQQWEGSWFQSGVPQPIDIQASSMSNRGTCIASDGDKFLMRDKRCHRCVVIYEKHKNVLQYKESMGCKSRETLQSLCDQIPGDALLYSMFRIDAEPIKCPIKGPYLFTYNRGHGECKNPVSEVESCTEESRMLLSFQACPDVTGTESTVEELTCLAMWKDGNARFLVGLISHNHATSNEERFRCFVYEKISGKREDMPKDAEYKLAQSGDATCNGLDSAEVGSRIMTLRKAPPVERCDFPLWIRHQKHWHTLSGSVTYTFHQNDGSMHIVKQNGYLETRVLCEQINKQTPTEMMAVVEKTSGCKSRFVCVMFYRRSAHVAELQMGNSTERLEHACAMNHWDTSRLPFITLLASNPDPEKCPLEGSYSLRGLISPPYSTSRHKRNHNSKPHSSHHHAETAIRSHASLSFRNEEDALKSWHLNDRNKSLRQRREADAPLTIPEGGAFIEVSDDNSEVSDIDDDRVIKLVRSKREEDDNESEATRSRRDIAINCGVNVNTKRRQLNVGCSAETGIDVSPQCGTDDMEEEYTCHGSWRENQTTFIVAKHSKYVVCISFKQLTTETAQLFIGDSCYRDGQAPDAERQYTVANLTNVGHKCGEISASTRIELSWRGVGFVLVAWLTATLHR